MPPVIPHREGRQIQALANPANQAKTLSQQPSPAALYASESEGDGWDFTPFDIGHVVEATGAGETFTIPVSTDIAFPINVVLEVFQAGDGQTTIEGAAGVTIVVPTGYAAQTAGQGATIGARQRETNVWALDGFLAAA